VIKLKRTSLFPILLLTGVLLVGAYLRFVGMRWGEYQYLHPDERFLIWVGTDISPVESLSAYWDTVNSSLNPHNRGHGFYVYGTLPMFLTRYVVEWVYGHSGFNEMTNVGRMLSALFDLATVFLVYLVGEHVYDRRVGLLGAAFSALAVLQIQHAHFFTMDTFTTFFAILSIYFAVRMGAESRESRDEDSVESTVGSQQTAAGFSRIKFHASRFISSPLLSLSLGFGVALGMAAASKVSAGLLALLLPVAFLVRYYDVKGERQQIVLRTLGYLVVAGLVSLLVFRVLQPYAFSGPGFFGLKPNLAWIANLKELRNLASGDVDFPPAIQWARRPVWFAWENIVFWGLGLPLGLLAWTGFLWAGWRNLKGEWRQHVLIWGWTAVYFTWQSLVFNPSMRYQLLIYPTLVIFAAWAVVQLYDWGKRKWEEGRRKGDGGWKTENEGQLSFVGRRSSLNASKWVQFLAVLIGGFVLFATAVYAFAFSTIYLRPITRVEASRWIYQNIPGPINLPIQTDQGLYNQPLPFPYDYLIRPELPFLGSFTAVRTGTVSEIHLGKIIDPNAGAGMTNPTPNPGVLNLILSSQPDGGNPLATASIQIDLTGQEGSQPATIDLELSNPVIVNNGETYYLTIGYGGTDNGVALKGAAVANEGAWDDGLPVRLDGYDGYGGIYPPGLNFDMYEDDNPDKLARFINILDQSDYILISSNRQWGSLPRLPERFPMNIEYYRNLLGCPPDRTIEWCYNVARPGEFQGDLGFDLVNVFQSDPTFGPWSINDQFAEEAFTVYDHPKVFVFKKRPDYNPELVRSILGAVDLSNIVHVTPKKAGSLPSDMMLPSGQLAIQQAGGTWSELFDTDSWQNRWPMVGLSVWYLAVAFLGFLTYPLLRFAMPGLSDNGYPLARTAGLLLLSYLVWLAGSLGMSFARLTITVLVGVMALVSAYLVYRQREGLRREWLERRRYFLVVEGLFLAFFIFDLLIRLGNPDLWHPWKGGEKPMDFSYFNAVLKSTTFPPYDPWFAGGYLNYYYYGFVLVGVLVKWLGIVPSVAYNLILPTVFSLIAMGAFSIGWNLSLKDKSGRLMEEGSRFRPQAETEAIMDEDRPKRRFILYPSSFIPAIAAALGMAVLGNLGIVRMILQGYQRLAAPGGNIEGIGLLVRSVWTVKGAFMAMQGMSLPFSLPDWYWIPSRAIPAPNEVEPITEFPFFTVLYGDPHANLFALPLTLLALSWALSVVLGRAWKPANTGAAGRSPIQIGMGFLLGGLVIGALRPTHTWDLPTYLGLGVLATGYSIWRNYRPEHSFQVLFSGLATNVRRGLVALVAMGLLTGLVILLFQPYARTYVLSYTAIDIWKGTHTPFWSYLTHWGLFLFTIISWMIWETRDWMAGTPLSALRKLQPYRGLIYGCLVLLVAWTFILHTVFKVSIAWLVLPLAAWSWVLILRPGIPDTRRIVLFMIGAGLLLTLIVEVIVLRGDIGRMNTVFRFYQQAWTLFSLSAAVSLGWLMVSMPKWLSKWRFGWQVAFLLLVASAALYPVMGAMAKVKDRITPEAPHTLDGMAYMQHATYDDLNTVMDLSQDYDAIRWLQENVKGSPVIVEGNMVEYHWGTRITIYTGLPNVIGWNWHQRQQRARAPEEAIPTRITDVNAFYLTEDVQQVKDFLQKYGVRYIMVGQLERALYPVPGLDKFEDLDGFLWKEVFRIDDTVIYEVLNQQ